MWDVSLFSYGQLLVALVSSYRYEGLIVNNEIAKSEAKTLGKAIKEANGKKLIENEDVIRILSTRSKLQLKATFSHYMEIHGKAIDEVRDECPFIRSLQMKTIGYYESRDS